MSATRKAKASMREIGTQSAGRPMSPIAWQAPLFALGFIAFLALIAQF